MTEGTSRPDSPVMETRRGSAARRASSSSSRLAGMTVTFSCEKSRSILVAGLPLSDRGGRPMTINLPPPSRNSSKSRAVEASSVSQFGTTTSA